VLFIGDSNMQQFYPRIVRTLADHPHNTHSASFATRGMCAPGAVEIVKIYRAACRQHLQNAIAYAKNPDVDTIVIGACWYLYFVRYRDADHFGEAGPLKPGTDLAMAALKRLVADFVRDGKRVYIVLQIPMGRYFDPRLMIHRAILPPAFTVTIPSPQKAEIERAIQPIVSKLLEIARDTGANVIDPMESLCDATTCPAATPAGEPMYWDKYHLRPSYVRENVHFLDATILDDKVATHFR
jgi:hypothetical protein